MKKLLLPVFILTFALFGLTGCTKYTSHYAAIGFVRSNLSDSAFMDFMTFDGTQVFKLKCKDGAAGISYSGKLQTGSLTVYYDCDGTKQELFSLRSGDEIASSIGSLPEKTVYILVETSEKCENGGLTFDVFYD